MKKCLVILVLFLVNSSFVSTVFAGSWGPTQLEYLDCYYWQHPDEPFSPGISGGATHKIQLWANATLLDKLQVSYAWRSNASPNWTTFQTSQYASTGYHTVDLYAGTSDVEFRVVFSKVDANSCREMTVSWKYYTDD